MSPLVSLVETPPFLLLRFQLTIIIENDIFDCNLFFNYNLFFSTTNDKSQKYKSKINCNRKRWPCVNTIIIATFDHFSWKWFHHYSWKLFFTIISHWMNFIHWQIMTSSKFELKFQLYSDYVFDSVSTMLQLC